MKTSGEAHGNLWDATKTKKKKNEGISEVDYANLMAACTECIHQAKIVSHRWRLLGIGYARLDVGYRTFGIPRLTLLTAWMRVMGHLGK